jgi:hypothetical protein
MNAPDHDTHDASHPRWGFRAQSAIWMGGRAASPNMAPFAHEMTRWLKREQNFIRMCSEVHRDEEGAFTNPYTYHASTHFGLISSAISAAVEFVGGTCDISPFEAEARRLRLYNELVMASARFCETVIKQMLYCTNVPHRLYRNWSLGQLMAAQCTECRKAGPPHSYSLLGALACQYFQCRVFDECGFDHLALVNRRRNGEAAHAKQAGMNVRTAAESRAELCVSLTEVLNDLEHMTRHIGDVERCMVAEIELLIASQPGLPSADAFLAIRAKPRGIKPGTSASKAPSA